MMYHIVHPLAHGISVITRDEVPIAMATRSTCEIAFFDQDGEWVLETIEEFEQYSDGYGGDTLVYGYVPNELVEDFLEKYSVIQTL